MLDRDSPPQEEGDTNGAGDGVRRDAVRVVRRAARARSIREFSPLPWITVTATIWAAIMVTEAEVRDGPVFPQQDSGYRPQDEREGGIREEREGTHRPHEEQR